jgi:hypothetical protein
LSQKNKAGGIILSDFKMCCKAIIIKTTGMGISIHTQTSGTEQILESNSCIYSQLIFSKHANNMHWRRDSVFN